MSETDSKTSVILAEDPLEWLELPITLLTDDDELLASWAKKTAGEYDTLGAFHEASHFGIIVDRDLDRLLTEYIETNGYAVPEYQTGEVEGASDDADDGYVRISREEYESLMRGQAKAAIYDRAQRVVVEAKELEQEYEAKKSETKSLKDKMDQAMSRAINALYSDPDQQLLPEMVDMFETESEEEEDQAVAAVEELAEDVEAERESDWRAMSIDELKLESIPKFGKARIERMRTEVSTLGEFENLLVQAAQEKTALSKKLPKGIGQEAADELEQRFEALLESVVHEELQEKESDTTTEESTADPKSDSDEVAPESTSPRPQMVLLLKDITPYDNDEEGMLQGREAEVDRIFALNTHCRVKTATGKVVMLSNGTPGREEYELIE